MKTVVAFANGRGGKIVFGKVNDLLEILKIHPDYTVTDLVS